MILRLNQFQGGKVYIPVWDIQSIHSDRDPNGKGSLIFLHSAGDFDTGICVVETPKQIADMIDGFFKKT